MAGEQTWIPVTERQPRVGRYVLVYSPEYGIVVAARCTPLVWVSAPDGATCDVSFWQPLPPKPKKRR